MKKITAAVADLLAREGNEALSAEQLAEEIATEIVSQYEEIQAKSYNLIVLGHFTPGDGSYHVAAVGPLSTRATKRAKDIGERFAWDYKTRRGTGKFTLVPLVRSPNEAWDDARKGDYDEYQAFMSTSVTPGVEPSYEAMRFEIPDEVRALIKADWHQDPDVIKRKYAPACTCGLSEKYIEGNKGYSKHGVPIKDCQRHPKEGSDGGSPGSGD